METITYEVSKFNPKPNSELLCAICICVLHDPRMCPCHHIFCGNCIRRWLLTSHTCPTCRSAVRLMDLGMAPPLVQNVLGSLTMICDYKDGGCDQLVSKENFPSHLTSCDYKPVTCPHKPCALEMKAKDLPAHTQQCKFRNIQCTKKCYLLLPAHELPEHDCVAALQNKIKDLDNIIDKQRKVLWWLREKLNLAHMPEEPQGLQLQAYLEMRADINQYWPEAQPYPLLFCGTYIPFTTTANILTSSAASTTTIAMNSGDNENAAGSSSNTVERVVTTRDRVDNRELELEAQDTGADGGQSAYTSRDTHVRSVVHQEDSHLVEASDMSDEGWESNHTAWHSDSQYYDYEDSYDSESRYDTPGHSPYSTRSRRRHDGNAQDQVMDAGPENSHEQSGSRFEEDHSYIMDSAGNYVPLRQYNYNVIAESADAVYDLDAQTDEDAPYSGRDVQDSTQYAVWDQQRPHRRSHRGPLRGARQRYSPSATRTPAEDYSPNGRFADLFYSPAGHGSISISSPTASHFPSQFTMHSIPRNRSSSQSQSSQPARRDSLSVSTASLSHEAGERDSRSVSTRSPSPEAAERDSRSVSSSSQLYSTSSQEQEEELANSNDFENTDDEQDDSGEEHEDWNQGWHPDEVDDPETAEVLDEGNQDDNVDIGEWYQDDGTDNDHELSEVSGEGTRSRHHSSEQADQNDLDFLHLTNRFEEHRERKTSSDESDETCDPNQQDQDEQPSKAKTMKLQAETFGSDSKVTKVKDCVDASRKQAQYSPQAGSSSIIDGSSALGPKKSEIEDVASDGPGDKKKKRKVGDLRQARNVWESSSDTTSLDYDIPAEELSTKPESVAEGSIQNTSAKHNDNISAKAGSSTGVVHMGGNEVTGGDNKEQHKNKSAKSDSEDEDLPLVSLLHRQRKGQCKPCSKGKGKALKVKRKWKSPVANSDSDTDSSAQSDSDVCFKRKNKGKVLDSSSDKEVSSRETETLNDVVGGGDNAHKTGNQENMPSTSHSSSDFVEKPKNKGKQKREKKADKKKIKTASCIPKGKNDLKRESKHKTSKDQNHSSAKRPRLDNRLSHRDSGAAGTSNSVQWEHQSVRQGNMPANHDTQPSAKMSSQSLASGLGTGATGAAQHHKKSSRSHTLSRHDLSERTNNGTENSASTSGITNSRVRRLLHRSGEASSERRGSERRVIESDSTRLTEHRTGALKSTKHGEDSSGTQNSTSCIEDSGGTQNSTRRIEGSTEAPNSTRRGEDRGGTQNSTRRGEDSGGTQNSTRRSGGNTGTQNSTRRRNNGIQNSTRRSNSDTQNSSNISAIHQERVIPPAPTRGLRIMRIENPYEAARRRRIAEERRLAENKLQLSGTFQPKPQK